MHLKLHLLISLLACLLLGIASKTNAQATSLWQDVEESKLHLKGKRQIVPQKHRTVSLDLLSLKLRLALSPLESVHTKKNGTFVVDFPMPDGSMQDFRVVESPVMDPTLAAKFPEIKTYLAQGIDDPYATMRFDVTHKGLHAMITSPKGTTFIDPYSSLDTENYISYYKKDFVTTKNFSCLVESDPLIIDNNNESARILNAFSNGATLRTYRLAVAATGEYTQFHGGTVADGQAAIVTTINRVNQVYENDLAIRLVLVANNDQLIYTDGANDPFNNNNAGTLINQSQTEIDAIIGDANYDIGHTVSTGGGGLAGLGIPCRSGQKARGITGSPAPVGDPYDIDYVAHEVGHQFGGNHTFNGSSGSCGGNISGAAYEPGSGTTIQAYAGICSPQNIQNNSDPYFHVESLNEMLAYSTAGVGDGCAAKTPTGNTPPVASVPMAVNLTIPASTPFELTGAGTDVDNDALTYCWEQYDLGPSGAPESATGNAPLFRSRMPEPNPVRTFPRLTDLINNTVAYGEMLPTYTRSMNFRLTLRDNRAGGGGVHCAPYAVDVDGNSGPFLVTSQNSLGILWPVGSTEPVTWDVANTTAAPVSCADVDILLSTDGGLTYPVTLASGVPNDGTHNIIVPNNPTNTGRIKVICSDNIFFDISNTNLEIQVTGPDFALSGMPSDETACTPDDATFTVNVTGFGGYADNVSLSASDLPAGAIASFAPATITGGTGTSTMTITTNGVAPGAYAISVNGNGSVGTRSATVNLVVLGGQPGDVSQSTPVNGEQEVSISPTFTWMPATEANNYEIQVATDLDFTNIVETATGIAATNHTPATDLAPNTVYYWRVRALNLCGASDDAPVYVFKTVNIGCIRIASTDIPITISTNGTPTITSTIDVTDAGSIIDLNVVNLNGTHTWINDLDFSLTSPAGTTVIFMNQSCNNQNDFGINLDDEASPGAWPCPPTGGGIYQPSSPLSAFDGEDLNGTWTLSITDNVDQDGGELLGWGMEICYTTPSFACEPSLVIPTETGTYTADMECTDGSGWTHYYKSASAAPVTPSNVLLLSVQKDAVVDISPSQVTVGVTGQGGAVDLSNAAYVTSTDGWFVMNRFWNVEPSTQPGPAGVNIRFYYSTPDYNGLRAAGAGIGVAVNAHSDLIFYKFASGSAANPDPLTGHAGGTTANYLEFPGAHAQHYLDHYAEFSADGFSGGGGGIGNGNDNGALPIQLVSFTGEVAERGNLLKWETEYEVDNDYFVLQHSYDAVDFRDLDVVDGAGNSITTNKYEYLHRMPEKADHFYRLKQVGFDGSFKYSNIVMIRSDKGFDFGIHPNPVQEELVVHYRGIDAVAKIWVYDAAGRQLYFAETEIVEGSNVLTVPVRDYAAGIYVMKVQEGEFAMIKRFIVK